MRRRIVEALAQTGAFGTAWSILEKEGLSDRIGIVVRAMERADSVDDALRVAENIADANLRVQALCNLAVAQSGIGRSASANMLLRQAITQFLRPHVHLLADRKARITYESVISMFESISESATRIGTGELLAELGRLAIQVKKPDCRDRILAILIPAVLNAQGERSGVALDLSCRFRSKGMKAHALASIAWHQRRSNGSQRTRELLDEAARLAEEVKEPEEQASTCLDVAKAMVGCGRTAGLDRLLLAALWRASSRRFGDDSEGESYASFLWAEAGSHTPEIQPRYRTRFLGECIELLKETGPGQCLDKALAIVQEETRLYDKACLAAKMVKTLNEIGEVGAAKQLMAETRAQLRAAVPTQRASAQSKCFHWRLGDDEDYVVEVAESLAVLQDADGLVSLVSHACYLSDPYWRPDWRDRELLITQAYVRASIVGHLVEVGRLVDARALVEDMRTDEERCEAVAQIVRILLTIEQRNLLAWVRAIADTIEGEVYREHAQRELARLMTHYGMEAEAWRAARYAIESGAHALAGMREVNLFNCLRATVDGVTPLASYGSQKAIEFIYYASHIARTLEQFDTWAFISALYPLITAVGGREIAERTWGQIQAVDNLRTDVIMIGG